MPGAAMALGSHVGREQCGMGNDASDGRGVDPPRYMDDHPVPGRPVSGGREISGTANRYIH